MPAPTWVPGQVLTASDVDQWFVPLAAYKVVALARTTNVLAIDPDLQFTTVANATYEVRASLLYQAGAGIGFSFQWTVPATAGTFGYGASMNLSGTGAGTYMFAWTANALAGDPSGNTLAVNIQGMLQTNAGGGTLGLQWASGTAGQTVTLLAASYLIARRMG